RGAAEAARGDDGPTDVMSSYPEDDEDFEPTVQLVDRGGFDAEIFDIESEAETVAFVEDEPGSDAGHAPAEEEGLPPDADHPIAPPAPGGGPAADAERAPTQERLTPQGGRRGVTTSEEIDYRPPPAKSLERGKGDRGPDPRDQQAVGRKLIETLGHFGVEAKIVGVVSGPHVSLYELRLAPGIKVKKVTELANDLAYALASTDIRILAPIPGKQAVGVEVPNSRRRMVRLGDVYAGRPEKTSPLVAWLGKGIDGNAVWTDLAKMPHVLVAGTTGSGKSGCVNAILSSILMQASPNEVRLVLVDPKQVELNHYENIPHLLTPVVTSPRLAANVLSNLIGEMESRYGIMSEARCRNLAELNRARSKAGEPPLPHILCVIDELADLMMVAPAEVEDSIIRLAQKSRATGIHLVLATQRPSTDIITGTIKVNIPSRIAFAVSSQTDSRVILDQGGAESLLGQGDMLFRGPGSSKLQRIQGAFVTEDEIARITRHWARQGEPEFEAELLEAPEDAEREGADGELDPDSDDLLDEAIRLVVQTETASVSMIQRRLRVGYTRAGRLIDMLERRGVISGYEGSKPRQVLISQADLPRVLGAGDGPPDAAPVAADIDEV
ncbi:MAG: DNA translocase FtsK, partial [Syntrophothermus sp.]